MRSLADAAYEDLRGEILGCRLAPGERLTEASVSEELGIGKTPVREALQRLVQDGLVRVLPRHGYSVTPITLRDVQELFGLRLIIEPAAAEKSALLLDDAGVAQLEQLARTGYAAGDGTSVRGFLNANAAFHLTVARACGSRRLSTLVEQMLIECERFINFGAIHLPRSELTSSEHLQLVEAFKKRDATLAREATEAHLRSTMNMIIESLLANSSLLDAHV